MALVSLLPFPALADDDESALHLQVVAHFQELAAGSVGELEKLMAEVGLDADRLLAGHGEDFGRGGPFIAAVGRYAGEGIVASLAALHHHVRRWGGLHQVLQSLPTTAPLESYRITSRFGRRADPISAKKAMHMGIDLGARSGTAILAAGPGVVTMAGWLGANGRIVEVDHGFGIRTRYAHLRSISVKRGERVERGEIIGKVGKSGRATGPHLHYEVLVDGKYLDPLGFMTLRERLSSQP